LSHLEVENEQLRKRWKVPEQSKHLKTLDLKNVFTDCIKAVKQEVMRRKAKESPRAKQKQMKNTVHRYSNKTAFFRDPERAESGT
jgi:hypothetical protein